MITLNKRDLGALFILLAVLFLFDSYGGNFLLLGVIVFLLMIILVWVSNRKELTPIIILDNDQSEIVFLIAIGAVFIGVLIYQAIIVAIGFLLAMVFLFMPIEAVTVDLWGLKLQTVAQKPKRSGKKSGKSTGK